MLASIPGYTAIDVILSFLTLAAGMTMLYRFLEPGRSPLALCWSIDVTHATLRTLVLLQVVGA